MKDSMLAYFHVMLSFATPVYMPRKARGYIASEIWPFPPPWLGKCSRSEHDLPAELVFPSNPASRLVGNLNSDVLSLFMLKSKRCCEQMYCALHNAMPMNFKSLLRNYVLQFVDEDEV